MKSPWKFLAELASRRRRPEHEATSDVAGGDGQTEAVKDQPQLLIAPGSPEAGSEFHEEEAVSPDHAVPASGSLAPVDDGAVPPAEPVAAQEVLPETVDRPSQPQGEAQPVQSIPANDSAPTVSGTKRVTAKEKGRTRTAAGGQKAKGDNDATQASPRENSFFGEATRLDQEISDLREQLARKLRLQNSQLKKMLERFDHP
ncbi:hypothetical protein [Rhizobium sp. BK376]|uniref:hypothetical protein n=1 Tax=Rhizobium sp. BK376 TaxID=2512149 RepID=UPI00104DB17D|nr:hypothetical protein [Rhizobium sp. BK376]TCR80821.1 hypothetical protein EV561_11398 [Rhizobium sp. BK376]